MIDKRISETDKGHIREADAMPTPIGALRAEVDRFVNLARADNTKAAYRNDWTHFSAWCDSHGASSLPASPETVAAYIADLATTHKPSTLERRLSSISVAHAAAGLPSPTKHLLPRAVLSGIRRSKHARPEQKRPLLLDDLREIVQALPLTAAGLRDKAIILVGFHLAGRRSEVAGLDVEDLREVPEGRVVLLRASKTDQEGVGVELPLPRLHEPDLCPVRSVEAWLAESGITTGPIFRMVDRNGRVRTNRLTGRAVAEVVKRRAAAVGLDPAGIGGHSLRSGYCTAATVAGASEHRIAQQSRHKSLKVLRQYIRRGELFEDLPFDGL